MATAIVSGIITKEWISAPPKARSFLYGGLALMVAGILVVAYANGLGTT